MAVPPAAQECGGQTAGKEVPLARLAHTQRNAQARCSSRSSALTPAWLRTARISSRSHRRSRPPEATGTVGGELECPSHFHDHSVGIRGSNTNSYWEVRANRRGAAVVRSSPFSQRSLVQVVESSPHQTRSNMRRNRATLREHRIRGPRSPGSRVPGPNVRVCRRRSKDRSRRT